MSAAAVMSSPMHVLARKEARGSLAFVAQGMGFALLAALGAKLIGAHDVLRLHYRELLLIVMVPLQALLLGGLSVASEKAEGTLAFLSARAASRRDVLLAKIATDLVTLVVALVVALFLVRTFADQANAPWLGTLQSPAHHALPLGLTAALVLYFCGFAASLLLDDPITACLAGVLVGGSWLASVLAIATTIAGSLEVALRLNPWLGLFLVVPPLSLVAVLVLGSRWDASTSLARAPLAAAGAALTVAALLPLLLSPGDVAHAKAARDGLGRVQDSPLLLDPTATAAAFVVGTKRGDVTRLQAAITFMGKKAGASELILLPPGTTPIGWTTRGSQLVVEWDGGMRRHVRLDGAVVDSTEDMAQPAASDSASLLVREGRLAFVREGLETQIYPLVTEVTP